MDRRSVTVDRDEAVAVVTLQGPGKGNAMGPDFWREAPEVFAELDADPAVRAVLLEGSGDHFCFGLDLMAMSAELAPLLMGNPDAAARAQLLDVILQMQRAISAAAECRKPVVAAVRGWCIGGGLDLVSACDLRVCSEDARFSLREVKLAMVADVGSLQRLPHVIGEAATRELAFTGKDIDAARALQLGLVSEVVDDVGAAGRALAREIAANPPAVVQGIKRIMNRRVAREIEAGLREVATWNAAFLPSNDLAEAIGAFAEKRAPKFTGS